MFAVHRRRRRSRACARRPTSCAPSWPATRSPSWSTATSTSPTCAWSAARSAASGRASARPDAYEHGEEEFRARVRQAIDYGATELCMQSGIHPDWDLDEYLKWLRVAKDEAARHGTDLHLHAYSPMEIAHMCDISRLPPRRGLRAAARRRAGLDAGHGRRGAARRRARAHQPQQAARRALGRDHRGQPRAPGCAPPAR